MKKCQKLMLQMQPEINTVDENGGVTIKLKNSDVCPENLTTVLYDAQENIDVLYAEKVERSILNWCRNNCIRCTSQ